MKRLLRDALVEHLGYRALDEEQLRHLHQLQHGWRARRTLRPWWLAVAAAVPLLVLVLMMTMPMTGRDPVREIADEVALNHLKMRPLEVRGGEPAELQAYFSTLGFRLIEPTLPLSAGGQMLGGRLCSVQGTTAAQLRLRDRRGRTAMLYQALYDPSRFGGLPDVGRGESPVSVQAHGLTVDLWVEHGLLLALTREQ